jgi:hypothetical protein
MKSITAYQLKWIAMITMTVDHFGVIVLGPYQQTAWIAGFYLIARLIGRIAFPLFAFMIVEGVYRTKNRFRYGFRLILMAGLIAGAISGLSLLNIQALAGNIFIDLSMAAWVMIFWLHPKLWIKPFALIPLAYIFWTSLNQSFPSALSPDYGLYGLGMMAMFFVVKTYPQFFNRLALVSPVQREFGRQLMIEQPYRNASIGLVVYHLIWYIIYVLVTAASPITSGLGVYLSRYLGAQTYAMFVSIILYRYRGNKGSSPRWFQAFTYAYYPLHFVVLYGLYLLTTF